MTRIATWATSIVLGASSSVAALSQPASGEDIHGGPTHHLVTLANHSNDVEKKAQVQLHCSSATGMMTLAVSGINTLDPRQYSFLAYFITNGVTPNVGWQLGVDAGNIVIKQNPSTGLWAGTLRLSLPHASSCSKGAPFSLTDQPSATGALKFSGVLS